MIFDGKAFAEEILNNLPRKKAKLAVFLDPNNTSGARYVKIKTEVAKRLGVEIVMNRIGGDEDGIMVQLPHPDSQKLISQIPPEKDVDGLREDSPYLPAVVRASKEVLLSLQEDLLQKRMVIVGSSGFVGKNLMKLYPNAIGMDKEDFDPEKIKTFDIVISATGSPNLIKDIKKGAICIDLGFPKGDFDPGCNRKASFFTPVPGGVGPVTVACLFENLLIKYSH
ncbi:bifunctional 5,10-methylenetetrahydrofolate dehydrogenase/5,10-methenyltetrahydrofolate cyclohydrolase [Candidatus Amesbacteria bacterium]|nr:bifunctional 5,10-methylenetetrahydrofolate dehydrogenase/5,10-methenyltetrahydrofolate cyclohydrolase [Candidatus Amesbacteria bacterium]